VLKSALLAMVPSHREAKRAIVRNSTDELLALLSLIWPQKDDVNTSEALV
jgi:hypothetical protein